MTELPVKAVGHRIVVRMDVPEYIRRALDSGLALPDETRSRHTAGFDTGTIVDIGPTAWQAFDEGKAWAKIGDRVMIVKYSGYNFQEDGELYRVINDEDIYTIVTKKDFNAEIGN